MEGARASRAFQDDEGGTGGEDGEAEKRKAGSAVTPPKLPALSELLVAVGNLFMIGWTVAVAALVVAHLRSIRRK